MVTELGESKLRQSDMTISDMIDKNVVLRADDAAIICGDVRWSFGDYAEEVDRLAGGLASLGLRKEDRIAVVAFNCPEYFQIYGAAARMGAIVIPVNWRLKPEEIQFILEDSSPKALIADPEFVEGLRDAADLRNIERRLTIGKGTAEFSPIDEVSGIDVSTGTVGVDDEDPLVIIYTAAVGGRPRGAVITHGNLVAANLQAIATLPIQSDSAYLNLAPLYHIGGLVMSLSVMHAGGRNVLIKKFNPKDAAELIEREKITIIETFPPMLSSILDEASLSGQKLSSLKIGTGLDQTNTIQRFQETTGATFWVCFGQTETMSFCTLSPFNECPGSSGREGLLARLRIVDDYDRDVPAGQAGEILVKGPIVFQGYWQMEEETAYTFRGGWHHTGDVGRLDEDGYLWYVKRKAEKELIKPGGENVYPSEVEKSLLEHPEVIGACVFGIPDEQWGEAIKAVCVRKAGSSLKPEELIEFVANRIARYKKPKYLTFVNALPRGENGEIERETVKTEYGLEI